MKKSLRSVIAAAGVASLIALAGCGSDNAEFEPGAKNDTESEGADPSDGTTTGEDDSGDNDGGSSVGEPIGATWPDPENLVAEDVFPTLKSADQKVRVGIEGIFVTEKTMELRMVFTPEENVEELRAMDITKNMFQEVTVGLIDRENLKKYSVINEIDGPKRYQTDSGVKARTGETVGFQIFYPAPVDDIDHVDVDLGNGLPIFEDVPLTFEG